MYCAFANTTERVVSLHIHFNGNDGNCHQRHAICHTKSDMYDEKDVKDVKF